MFKAYAYPRAALIGNPSDGYYGKCIAFVFSNFQAEVNAQVSDKWRLSPLQKELEYFNSLNDLDEAVQEYGYYGGKPIMLAGLKIFSEYAQQQNWELPTQGLKIRYQSNIPTRLGLAGSSALITALFKVLLKWAGKEIPPAILANLVLSVEKDELGIGAGLQDRVAQAFETPVFMDFDQKLMASRAYGNYSKIDLKTIKENVFIAFQRKLSEGSEKTHNTFQQDFKNGNPEVLAAIDTWKKLCDECAEALKSNDTLALKRLINTNFDLRKKHMQIKESQQELVEKIRSNGAAAKFSGSGGAAIALADSAEHRNECIEILKKAGIEVIVPEIVI